MQAGSAIAAAVGSSVYSVIIRLGLRIKQEGWSLRSPSGRIRNVQKFYAAYYHFWLHGGVWGACVHQFGVVGKYLILVGAVVFLLFSVNWDAVMKCKTADDCDHATLVNAPTLAHLSLLQSLLGVAFTSVFLMTACYEVAQLCKQIIQLNEVHDSLDPFCGWCGARRRNRLADFSVWTTRRNHARQKERGRATTTEAKMTTIRPRRTAKTMTTMTAMSI
mgnify:CR=1 FL=1